MNSFNLWKFAIKYLFNVSCTIYNMWFSCRSTIFYFSIVQFISNLFSNIFHRDHSFISKKINKYRYLYFNSIMNSFNLWKFSIKYFIHVSYTIYNKWFFCRFAIFFFSIVQFIHFGFLSAAHIFFNLFFDSQVQVFIADFILFPPLFLFPKGDQSYQLPVTN